MSPGVKKGTRPKPQTLWLKLNIPSIILTIIPVFSSQTTYNALLGPNSIYSLIFLPIFFLAMASIDIYYSGPMWFGRHRPSRLTKKDIDKFMRMASNKRRYRQAYSENIMFPKL